MNFLSTSLLIKLRMKNGENSTYSVNDGCDASSVSDNSSHCQEEPKDKQRSRWLNSSLSAGQSQPKSQRLHLGCFIYQLNSFEKKYLIELTKVTARTAGVT